MSCLVESCSAVHYGRGYCKRHYMSWWRYQDPLASKPPRFVGTGPQRFMHFVNQTDHCWHWEGAKTTAGYGHWRIDKAASYAHRWSYEFFVGPIPEGMSIDHLCRNHGCVNPQHLEPVTHTENMQRGWRSRRSGLR